MQMFLNKHVNIFYDCLNIFFSLASFMVRIQNIIRITYKLCVNQLYILLARLAVNSRQLVVEGDKITDFQLPMLVQLHIKGPSHDHMLLAKGDNVYHALDIKGKWQEKSRIEPKN